MSHHAISTDQAPKAIGPYSQAIFDGKYLFVSGQLPLDPISSKLVEGDITLKTERVLNNIQAILKQANLDFQNIVRLEIFMKDLAYFKEVNSVLEKAFCFDPKPARQTIQVANLPLNADIEISCIAVRP